MKRIVLLLLLALHPSARAESADPLARFSPEARVKFQEASDAYNSRDYATAMAKVGEVEKSQPGTALLANFKGAIHLDRKEYEAAAACFDEAVKIDPAFWPARYNRIEIPFRLGKYAEARAKYETLLAQNPKFELFQYRIYLTYILEKNQQAAQEVMDKLPFPGDTPAYYYAHVMWELTNGRDKEADKFLRGAAFAFSVEKRKPFLEPLEILGWLGAKKAAGQQTASEQDDNQAPKSRLFQRPQ